MGKVRRYKDWERVSKTLWEVWDPIGVNAIPEAVGEYDTYATDVLELLRRGCSRQELTAHLRRLEAGQMGMAGGATTAAAVNALFALELDGT
jgi:hypothetical protein